MQNPQDPRAQAAKALTAAIRNAGLTDMQLSQATGVDYHAIRRMRQNGITNWSKNATALCSFLGLSPGRATPPQDPAIAWMEQKVRSVWDGTPEHRKFIEELLVVAGRYRVTPR